MRTKKIYKDAHSVAHQGVVPVFFPDAFDLIRYCKPTLDFSHKKSSGKAGSFLDHFNSMDYILKNSFIKPVIFSTYLNEFLVYLESNIPKGLNLDSSVKFIESIRNKFDEYTNKNEFFNFYLSSILSIINGVAEGFDEGKVEDLLNNFTGIDHCEINSNKEGNISVNTMDCEFISETIRTSFVDLEHRESILSQVFDEIKKRSPLLKTSQKHRDAFLYSTRIDIHNYMLLQKANLLLENAFNRNEVSCRYCLFLVSTAPKSKIIHKFYKEKTLGKTFDIVRNANESAILQILIDASLGTKMSNAIPTIDFNILQSLKFIKENDLKLFKSSLMSEKIGELARIRKNVYFNSLFNLSSRVHIDDIKVQIRETNSNEGLSEIFSYLLKFIQKNNIDDSLQLLKNNYKSISDTISLYQALGSSISSEYHMPFGSNDGVISLYQRTPVLLFSGYTFDGVSKKSISQLLNQLASSSSVSIDVSSILLDFNLLSKLFERKIISSFLNLISLSSLASDNKKEFRKKFVSLLFDLDTLAEIKPYKTFLDKQIHCFKSGAKNDLWVHEDLLYLSSYFARMSNDYSLIVSSISKIQAFLSLSAFPSVKLNHALSLLVYSKSRFVSLGEYERLELLSQSIKFSKLVLDSLDTLHIQAINSSLLSKFNVGVLNSYIYRNCKFAIASGIFNNAFFDRSSPLSLRSELSKLRQIVDVEIVDTKFYENLYSINHTESLLEYCESQLQVLRGNFTTAGDILKHALRRNSIVVVQLKKLRANLDDPRHRNASIYSDLILSAKKDRVKFTKLLYEIS